MKKLAFSFFLILATISFSFAQHSDVSEVSAMKQDKWIQETIREFNSFSPDSSVTAIIIDQNIWDDGQKLSCRIVKCGILRLDNGGWIYFKTTSSHENKEIGDVSMAVDDKKNIYKNMGHVCGGIIHFETTQLTKLKETSDFFKFFICDTDSASWEKVEF